MSTPGTRRLKDEMNVVASQVRGCVKAGEQAGLSKDAAALAALIGVLSSVRVDGLDEASLLKEASRAVPPPPERRRH